VSESSTDQQAPVSHPVDAPVDHPVDLPVDPPVDHGDLPEVPQAGVGTGSTVSVDDVTEAMKDVVDPELGINVVDLGLVYDVHLDEGSNVVLDMTLTSAACPLTDVIMDQTNSALEGLVNDVAINWVWMPPWGPDKITPDGREQLRALGFNV
jgi:metal-sulfur cluster biosynthetic enzyme